MTRLFPVALLLAAASLAACSPTLKSYADPTLRKGSLAQLQPLEPPLPVRVEVQFQQQGEPRKESDLRLRGHVERTLRESRVLAPDQMATALLRVVVNNVGDVSAARMAGARRGLTFGTSGGVVTDEYQFNIGFTGADGRKQEVFFRHALHSTLDAEELPGGIEPQATPVAYGQVVQDAVAGALLQLQADGALASRR